MAHFGSEQYVYFIRSPINGLIKIGWSRFHPDSRFADIQACSPVHLEKVGVIRRDETWERHLHSLFRKGREHSEWFRPISPLLDYIRDEVGPWPEPEPDLRVRRGNPVDPAMTPSFDGLHGEVDRLRDCLIETGLTKNRVRLMTPERMRKYVHSLARKGGEAKVRTIREEHSRMMARKDSVIEGLKRENREMRLLLGSSTIATEMSR